MTDPVKVRASSSSFAKGSLVFTRYNTGCLRAILAKSHGLKDDFKQITKDIGAANEERFERTLGDPADGGPAWQREVPISSDIVPDGSAVFSGRCDFVIATPTGREVVELKSTSSKNKLTDLKQGLVTPEVVAQITNYLIEFETTEGRIIYTFYKTPTEPTYERAFAVTVDVHGTVLLDGADTGFTVADALQHRLLQVEVLKNQTVGDRPYNWSKPYSSPCDWCPFKKTCDAWDAGQMETTAAFLNSCKEEMEKTT